MRLGLRLKFGLLISIIICAMMGLIGVITIQKVSAPLENEIRKKAEALINNLTENAKESLLTQDEMLLAGYLDKIKKDKSVIYAMLLDKEQKVIVHSDLEIKKGTVFNDSLKYKPNEIYKVSKDIEIKGKLLGSAVVAFSRKEIKEAVDSITKTIFLITAILLILGIVVSWFFVNLISKPLQCLACGVEIVGTGNLDYKIPIKSKDEIGDLALAFNNMTDKLKQMQQIMIEKEKLQHEIKIAKQIQESLLPDEDPRIKGFEISTLYRAAKDVGGDYYDFLRIDSDKLGIVIADVSGKGVPGALGMTVTRSILRAQANKSYLPSEVLSMTNTLFRKDMKKGIFVTMFYAILNTAEKTLLCSNAGHYPLLLMHKDKKYETVNPMGMALGFNDTVFFDELVENKKVDLKEGDVLILYTDGIIEAINDRREEFGEKRLIDAILNNAEKKSSEIVKAIEKSILDFTGSNVNQYDDITVVAVKVM